MLYEKSGKGYKPIDGKFQYGQVSHAEKRAEKYYGGKLYWESVNDVWLGTDKKGKIWFKIHHELSNPMKARKSNHPNHGWYVEKMVKAQRQADYSLLNNLKADLRKMTKVQSDNIKKDFRDGYKAWYDAQQKGGVIVRGGVHRKNNPEIEVRELILFAENSPTLHNQFVSIMKNLSRKQKKGNYDPVLAAKLWKYWIDESVKQYNKEILGGGYSLRQSVFSIADRKQAAIEMEEQERDEIISLEYLNNPGKRKMAKKKRSAKQLANDKRLGRMAKARAKAKRGGARKKTARKKVAKRKVNPKRTSLKKSHLWIGFKCKGNDVRFLTARSGKFGWTLTKGDAILFNTKSHARDNTMRAARAVSPSWAVGIADRNETAATIRNDCAGK